ncbi:ABC transporter permease [Luteitalea sp.]|uniref:ABC transporter permease n=1 Tax=Luteitalea sp. TaxID=2004800 RepID=UPI0025BCD9DB|nr:ABC transporter permease [Luteitalea sp.]
MDAIAWDIRYALRHVRRAPAFAAAVAVTLGLGIGANTAILSMLSALLWQRLPIPNPDGLIAITSQDARGRDRYIPFPAVPEVTRLGMFDGVCGYNGGAVVTLDVDGVPSQAVVGFVSGQCFEVFGVLPSLGRPLTDNDAPLVTPGNRVVVISDRYWRKAFHGEVSAVGRIVAADGVEAEVVGVLPPGFAGLHVDAGIDVFAPPDTLIPARADRRPVANQLLVRARAPVTIAEIQAEMTTRWPSLLTASVPPSSDPQEGADLWGDRLHVAPIATGISSYRLNYVPALRMSVGLTGTLLLLACINLGGLMLTRLSARRSEVAVRLALGGSRRRVVRQLLIEGAILSSIGALLAIPVSLVLTSALTSFLPIGAAATTVSFAPTPSMLVGTMPIGTIVGMAIAALPAWLSTRGRESMQLGSTRTVARAAGGLARVMLVVQIGLSVSVVVGAVLLLRSLYGLQHVDLGVRTDGLLDVKLMTIPNGAKGPDPTYFPRLIERLASEPGVRSVGVSQVFPRLVLAPAATVAFVGDAPGDVRALSDTASPEFFDVVGIPLLRGRLLSWQDTPETRRVAVVSESLAKALRPDGDVVDRRVNFGTFRDSQDVVIVGIVGDASAGNPRLPRVPMMYLPPLQRPFSSPNVIVAAAGDSGPVSASVRRVLTEENRHFALEIVPVAEVFRRAPAGERMSATLAAAAGGFALLLAVIGIHATLAYSVSQRRREIGVRLAIGADPRQVAASVRWDGFRIAAAGVAVGLPLAWAGTRLLRATLFGVSPTDPVTFLAVAFSFGVLGALGAVVPSWRAAAVDPGTALKAD